MVDYERLAAERKTLDRVYELGQLPRLHDLLADRHGAMQASFGFAKTEFGRIAVAVSVEATLSLICQRCLGGYAYPVVARSEVGILTEAQAEGGADEVYVAAHGLISLRELAEEELLLALPLIPACSKPEECGKAPVNDELTAAVPVAQQTVRPLASLQDLLKKHDRK